MGKGFFKRAAAFVMAAVLCASACTVTAFAAGKVNLYEYGHTTVGIQDAVKPQEDGTCIIDTDYKVNFFAIVKDGQIALWTKYASLPGLTERAVEYAVKNHAYHCTGEDTSAYSLTWFGHQIGTFDLTGMGDGWGLCSVEDTWATQENGTHIDPKLGIGFSGSFDGGDIYYGYYAPDRGSGYNYDITDTE